MAALAGSISPVDSPSKPNKLLQSPTKHYNMLHNAPSLDAYGSPLPSFSSLLPPPSSLFAANPNLASRDGSSISGSGSLTAALRPSGTASTAGAATVAAAAAVALLLSSAADPLAGLPQEAKSAVAALSVFPGSFDEEGAAQVRVWRKGVQGIVQ